MSTPRRLTALLLALLLCLPLPAGAGGTGPFPDVPPDSWYCDAVSEMTELGLFTGCGDGTFQPLREITAAEFVSVTLRATGQEFVLKGDHWASAALYHAREAGWFDWDEIPFDGYDWSACDKPISRQLAVKVLMRSLLPGTEYDYLTESQKIKDFSALSGRYYDTTLAAYAAGVVTGDGAGNFRPTDTLTRAEACALFLRALDRLGGAPEQKDFILDYQYQPPAQPLQTVRGGVSENGALQVMGTQLCNERGEPVLLRGMSSHGLQWYGQFTSPGAIASTARWGANLFRVAMYTGEGGYLSDPRGMEEKAVAALDAAIAQDLYVILDWHILSDGDPMAHLDEAWDFFTRMARRYKDSPNVLFEICNEPNGNVTWAGQVKPYAQQVVNAIRDQGADNVILIGSPTWSQDVHLPAEAPVEGTNLMYTLHFYAGTHGQSLRDRAQAALDAGAPLFVSEWGTSRADGSGGVFPDEAAAWLDFLEAWGISWCNWSLCDKAETSAALRPGASPQGGWTEQDLSESGRFVFSRLAPSTETEKVVDP